MEKTHLSAGILYFNLKGLKLTLQVLFLLHQKAQIPDQVFDLQEETCQCAWLCPGDMDILGQVAVEGLLVAGVGEGGEGGDGGGEVPPAVLLFLFFPAVLGDFDKDMRNHWQR